MERYDRARTTATIRRLHQEDFCPVLGLPPTSKYQNEGGPGCADISDTICTHSRKPRDDARTFVSAVMLNWIIGGTDAHAKNFSMLIGAGNRARLAPLYDNASALPYEASPRAPRLATKIGGKYRLEEILQRHWVQFAVCLRVGIPAAEVLEIGNKMARGLP